MQRKNAKPKRHYLIGLLCSLALLTVQCAFGPTEESGRHSSTQATTATVVQATRVAPSPVAGQPTATTNPATATRILASAPQPTAAIENTTAPPTPLVTTSHTATTQQPTQNPAATPTPIQPQGPSATHTPTAAPPLPNQTAPPAIEAPVIHYFRANVATAKPGDTVVVEWSSSGADSASLVRSLPSGIVDPNFGASVEPTGNRVYEISWDADHGYKPPLTLTVWNANAPTERAHQTLDLDILCSREWFFESGLDDMCPNEVRTSNAAVQKFDRGTMVWIEEFYWADSPTANNRTIYVWFDNAPDVDGARNSFRVFTDEWDESQPDFDPEIIAPTGLYQPVRGFGNVWRDHPEIRERIGWAVGEEEGFVITMQADTAYEYPHLYMQMGDDHVLDLWPISQTWEVVK